MLLLHSRHKKGEVKVAYCPTTNMLGDFFAKLLQGSMFKDAKLNLPNTDKINAEHRSVLENEIMSTKNTKTTRKNQFRKHAETRQNIGKQDQTERHMVNSMADTRYGIWSSFAIQVLECVVKPYAAKYVEN